MSMIDPGARVSGRIAGPQAEAAYGPAGDGSGWRLFAAIVMAIVALLNVIWGIAAISESRFFVEDTRYIISSLNTWGWVALVIGVVQLAACASIIRGGEFGRWFGIATAGVNAITALLSIPAYPAWSLTVFAIDILIVYGLAVYGGRRAA